MGREAALAEDRASVDARLDVAQAIGLLRQLRGSADILTGSPDSKRLGAQRLTQLLQEYDAVISRLAQTVEREADTIRQKLDALEPRRTPLGEPDDTGANALVNATVEVRDMVDKQTSGDVARFAQLVSLRVSTAVNRELDSLRGGGESEPNAREGGTQ
jgi:hypothetical protein